MMKIKRYDYLVNMRFDKSILTCLILVVGSGSALAADFGRGDVFGQAGVYSELGQGGGTWGIFGGGASFHLNSHLSVFGELNYVHPTSTETTFFDGTISVSGNLIETGGGIRIFPTRYHKIRPYIPVEGGFMHVAATGSEPTGYPGISLTTSTSANGAYFGTGFGVEVGITPRFGLRPEFRFFREFSNVNGVSADDNATTFAVGAYYRFGKL